MDNPYASMIRLDVFDHISPERQRPDTPLDRPIVAEMLSRLVPKLSKQFFSWCAYLATISGLCEIEGDQVYPPDDWMAMEAFVLAYEVPTEAREEKEIPEIACGRLSTKPRGEMAVELGGYKFYRQGEMAPVNDQVIDWYMEKLLSESVDVPPMRANYDNPFEMGRALKQRRIEKAFELIGAIDKSRMLYIPGDGVGAFSYAARKLGRIYYSSEVGGVGQIAIDLGLIRAKEPYTPLIFEQADYVMVASNLVPFCPDILKWPGPMVVYDVQSFWHNHPPHLKLLQNTNYRVYATEDAGLRLSPIALAPRRMLKNVDRWVAQMEALQCAAFMSDDRKSIVALLEAHLPVVSRVFAHAGYNAMIYPPDPDVTYMIVGREAGSYDLFTCTDHNTVTAAAARTFVYGRDGTMIYGSYGNIDRTQGQRFAEKMVFKTMTSYQKIYGKTRSFHHFRLRPIYNPRTHQNVTGVRTKMKPAPNIVVLAGYHVVTAIVVETWYVSGYFESEVQQGTEIATVYNRDIHRYTSELEMMAATGQLAKYRDKQGRQKKWAKCDLDDG